MLFTVGFGFLVNVSCFLLIFSEKKRTRGAPSISVMWLVQHDQQKWTIFLFIYFPFLSVLRQRRYVQDKCLRNQTSCWHFSNTCCLHCFMVTPTHLMICWLIYEHVCLFIYLFIYSWQQSVYESPIYWLCLEKCMHRKETLNGLLSFSLFFSILQ